MKKILAIQANALNSINTITDTTLLLAREAQKRSYHIYWYQTKDLKFIKGQVYAEAKKVIFFENKKKFFKIRYQKNKRIGDFTKIIFKCKKL